MIWILITDHVIKNEKRKETMKEKKKKGKMRRKNSIDASFRHYSFKLSNNFQFMCHWWQH